ncbi:four-carbon acid sugar kinase family protein [Rhizobium sp. SGZ-381]|uniref:four-carbon acid sugar kinase family protein n=1 Tax=Rhizobium sp. SGZ-381 TaxID=3342800 RepID=UPI00366A9E3C
MHSGLRIIADDLTGALDSACAFASPEWPVPVGWTTPPPSGNRMAISTESRHLLEAESMLTVENVFHLLNEETCNATLWFKKVDSVLRGHPVGETIALYRAGGFDHLVFAPAFPDLGRLTIDGWQMLQEGVGNFRRAEGPSLVTAFAGHGLTAHLLRPPYEIVANEARTGGCVWIVDAKTQQDLQQAAARIAGSLPGRVLWSGSGGLALALANAGARPSIPIPPITTVITGTRHPVTLRQLERLSAGRDPHSRLTIHSPSVTSTSPAQTARRLGELARSLAIPGRDEAAVVIGGDSLVTVLVAAEACDLLCIGEAARGVPISQVRGGRLDGVTLLTKSGGFGGDDLLAHLLSASRSAP